ncbi:ATP phosphoribosyltransferase regulatory subunit [bioreactor metagenome]|uniref:ATP phosphoribosyltransferase regulatory subunit n=1 Tax=bioreactor metagenome TaxID=1076179 RepID=A0A644THD6_9ZZZZ|nr:ATP phosphoribosyltransferase regulatory subunit [Negativicutes bacterium]
MTTEVFVPKIPYGTRDLLQGDANRKRNIEAALGKLFASWGYDEVVTPTIEYLETLSVGNATDLQHNMFKFFDKSNRILALRPDMTTPIARVAATRLRERALPLKLFYLTNVFRYEEAQAGRQCEFYQAGIELLGVSDPTADAEVIAIAVEAMLEAGLTSFQVSLGQVEFIHGIMNECGLPLTQQQAVKQSLVKRDLVGMGEILQNSGLCPTAQKILTQVPVLHGRQDMLKQAYDMVTNQTSRNALDNLSEIYNILVSYGVDKYVNFDLGIIRDFEYYTGMVFEGYTPGLGFPLCGGGRYDKMVSSFGVDCPATGFALGIERILLAMERQGIAISPDSKDIYIGWNKGMFDAAIVEASQQRRAGKTVELAFKPQSQLEAATSQVAKGYNKLTYIGG